LVEKPERFRSLRYHRGMPIDMRELARVGAEARLQELLAEVAEIQRIFPGIGGTKRGRPAKGAGAAPAKKAAKRGRRRKMSAGEKAEVSARMKRYWAARRKEKAKG
jgi:hypothetical protein